MGCDVWGPRTKLYHCPAWYVEVGHFGALVIKPVEIVLEILLESGQLHKLALVRCVLCTFKEVIAMLVHGR